MGGHFTKLNVLVLYRKYKRGCIGLKYFEKVYCKLLIKTKFPVLLDNIENNWFISVLTNVKLLMGGNYLLSDQ